jgi:hypothetical protein
MGKPADKRPTSPSNKVLLAAGLLSLGLAACEPVSITMMGVGAGAGVGHQLGGIVYKTFTVPEAQVKKASLAALKRMAIKVGSVEKIENGEKISAKAADRNIEIELEALTPNTTRMRAVARKDGGILVDSATAVEIITQTEKALGSNGS